VSSDGRWIVYNSDAVNLVHGQVDNNNQPDIFLYDSTTGGTTLVSHAAGSPLTAGNGFSWFSGMSSDGRWITFISTATNLVPGQVDTNTTYDIFLFDRESAMMTLVSHIPGAPTIAGEGTCECALLSRDGSRIAFACLATNLVDGQIDNNGEQDLFIYDRASDTTSLVSHSSGSPLTAASALSWDFRWSADGAHLAFYSQGTDLVTGQVDTDDKSDLFLYNLESGSTMLVSRASGTTANGVGAIREPIALSPDERWIVFQSLATNLIPGQIDDTFSRDLFLFDSTTGAMELLTHPVGVPTQAAGSYDSPTMSADSRWVSFTSPASDLVVGQNDSNGTNDVFLYDRLTGQTGLVSHRPGLSTLTDESGYAGSPSISADGGLIAFNCQGLLVAGQQAAGSLEDVCLYDRESDTNRLASHSILSPLQPSSTGGDPPVISEDGSSVVFNSDSGTDLVAGDLNHHRDVFAYRNGARGSFFTVPPCRLADTREPGQGPPLTSHLSRIVTAHSFCGIPETAKALALNVTVTQPTGQGHLTLGPSDAVTPFVSTINFSAGQTRANNAVVPLARNGSGTLSLWAALLNNTSVQVIVDVSGYFE